MQTERATGFVYILEVRVIAASGTLKNETLERASCCTLPMRCRSLFLDQCAGKGMYRSYRIVDPKLYKRAANVRRRTNALPIRRVSQVIEPR